jgi:hypothetical protein
VSRGAGIDASERAGRYRWGSKSRLTSLIGYRHLSIRHERRANLFQRLLYLARAVICLNFVEIMPA